MTFLIAWFGAGALLAPFSYGLTFAHFQRKFPALADMDYSHDRRFALFMGLLTISVPILIAVPFFCSGFGRCGLKFR